MLQKLAHYVSAMVFLLAAAIIYQMMANVWLRPPRVQTVRPRKAVTWTEDETLADLFPSDAWQRGKCKRLKTDDGVLLFEHWEQTAEDQWKLWPITLVVGRGRSGDLDPEPVIMEAPAGAELKFTEALDVMSGGAPPIDRGRLVGDVQIHRPSKDENESFSIRTSNVGINSRKLWTTETIHMKVGKASMVGRDLTLFLAVAAGTAPKGDGIASVLDRMQLTYLDELLMPLESPLWDVNTEPPEKPTRLPTTRSVTPLPATISITCGGRVDYDFAVDQLSLRNSISLIHRVPGGVIDQFDCDAIDLNLRSLSDKTLPRTTPLDWINRITATGTPASLNLPSFDVELKAERIEFDAVGGFIKATGRDGVEVRRGNISARLTQFEYQYDPRQPKAIGAIDARGAGIVTVNDPDITFKEVRWREELTLHPMNVTLIEAIDSNMELRVRGAVEAKFPDGGFFNADDIYGVFKPVKKTNAKKPQKSSVTFVPERLQATGNVHVDTAAIAAETKVLRLYFDNDPHSTALNAGAESEDQATSPLRQWIAQPGAAVGTVDPVARPRPVIRGDEVVAQMHLSKSGARAQDLSVVGSVELTHVINAGGQILPTKLTGEELRLRVIDGKDSLQLGSGVEAPAKLNIGDGFFIGPMILIWPNENLVQIQGAGEFQMPSAILPTALLADDPTRIHWIKQPHCKWNGGMRFDGKKVVLSDGVDIRAELLDRNEPWGIHLMGDKLEIVFLEDVKISEVQTIKRAAVQRITMLQSNEHPVIVNAERRAADGVLEGRHVLHAPRLNLYPSGGGKLVGAGPGWYRAWVYAPKKGLIAKTEPAAQQQRQLTGIHLTYHEALEGNLTNKTLAFLRGVRVGMRPLETWKDVFDAKEMNEISAGQSTLDCDRLGVAIAPGYADTRPKIPGLPTPWEMEAVGGVVFRTRTDKGLLEATAARVAYTSGKDHFMIEGAPNRGAIVQRTRPNGERGFNGTVSELTIDPKTFEVIHSKWINFNMGQLPTSSKR